MSRYPDAQTLSVSISDVMEAEARALLADRQRIEPLGLENEYTRFFVNALPEVPCAPYGSVYLESSVMGAPTVQLSKIYQRYYLYTDEMPDHTAVRCKILAWLLAKAEQFSDVNKDCLFLYGHLRKRIIPFLTKVEQHGQLGWYRSCAEWTRRLFPPTEQNVL